MALTKIKLNTMITGTLPDANIPDNITVDNAATATALETARTIHGVSFDGTANIDLTEAIQDVVGGMVASNTETNIAVTYDDTNGKLDFASTDTNTFRPITAGGNTLGSSETLAFTAGSNVTITENGGAVTIASTDTNTTYSVGDGGLTQNNFTDALKTKLDGIAASANNYSLPLATSSTRGGVKVGYTESGKNYPVELDSEKMYVNVPWTDTNTTYSVGDGGLTQNNFTDALKSKLDGIETGATADQDLSGYATLSGATFSGAVTFDASPVFSTGASGTLASRDGYTDFIGYNPTYGSYIGGGVGNATRYLYAGGYFHDGSVRQTLYHTGNLNPITTSNIGSQSVSYASNSGTLSGHDTRSVTTTPQTINAGVKFDFKNNSSNGLSDGGSYHGLMTYRQYGSGGDWSGGHAHQIGFTDNTRLYHRSGTGTSWNTGWYKIHTQRDMPNSGYNGADVTLRTNSNSYLVIQNWVDIGSSGIYSSSVNGFHFLPNQSSDYGSARIIGTRSGYSGINYNNKTTLMMADDTMGFYNDENNEWMAYGNRNGNFYTFYNGATRTATYLNGLYIYGNGSGDAYLSEANNRTLILSTARNSSEFHVGENAYSYGNMSLRGSSNSYQGIVMPIHSNYPTMMFNTSSNGGFYYQSGRWAFYHNYGHNCAGINTSGTSSSYRLYVNGSAYATGSWSSSDARLKKDVTTIENSLDKVMNMRGVYFNWIPEDREKARQTGVIAQEVLEILPECVNHDEENDEYSVDYNKITAVLIESIKDLKNEINELKKGCCNGS